MTSDSARQYSFCTHCGSPVDVYRAEASPVAGLDDSGRFFCRACGVAWACPPAFRPGAACGRCDEPGMDGLAYCPSCGHQTIWVMHDGPP